MYDDHFGLTDRPFQLTPDPRFWFDTATHRKAMSYLGYGLAQGEGFIVITGDIGAGKTTLVGHLMNRIDESRMNVIKIVSTAIEAEDLLRIVATGLGIASEGKSKAELLTLIERGLHTVARTGRRTLLIVDEAQALPVSALEELRMLSNFQAGGHAMLQIFLLGQPEFRQRLNGTDRLEQLRQRIIAIHHSDPMGEDEIESYVAHRLQVAGWQGRPDFAVNVFPALYAATGGVPRRLNQLMSRVLLNAAISNVDLIDANMIDAVVNDAARESPSAPAFAPVVSFKSSPSVLTDAPASQPTAPVVPLRAPGELPTIAEIQAVAAASGERPSIVAARAAMAAAKAANGAAHPIAAEPAASEPVAEDDSVLELTTPLNPPAPVSAEEHPVTDARSNDEASLADRVASLEIRVEEQDAALRRVLTLLVDWVESDSGWSEARQEAVRGAAA